MSGPKCGEFTITQRRRQEEQRRIEEQLRREEKKRREEQKRIAEQKHREEFEANIEKRREELKAKLLKKREQEIISEAINEAMEDMGYDLVATLEPKQEAELPVQAKVFSLSEGVGVQVIENNGRISMEVVGLGTNNRKPTEPEEEYLEKQMEVFCDSYDKLTASLEEKGIERSVEIHRLPPDKKYARILNLESFSLQTEVDTLQTVMARKQRKSEPDEETATKAKRRLLL